MRCEVTRFKQCRYRPHICAIKNALVSNKPVQVRFTVDPCAHSLSTSQLTILSLYKFSIVHPSRTSHTTAPSSSSGNVYQQPSAASVPAIFQFPLQSHKATAVHFDMLSIRSSVDSI